MKKLLTILMFLMVTITINAQVPWTVYPTSVSDTVYIPSGTLVTYNDLALENGDAIGVFYDSAGTQACAGFLEINGTDSTFVVYGNDAVDNGPQVGEFFDFVLWKNNPGCFVYNPFVAMSYAQFAGGNVDTVMLFQAQSGYVAYPNNYFCLYNLAAFPVSPLLTNVSLANLSFSSAAGLSLNATTGDIEDPSVTIPGTYTIDITTLDNQCLDVDSFVVTTTNKLLSNPTITVADKNCYNNGSIELDIGTVANGLFPYTVYAQAMNISYSNANSDGNFYELESDTFRVVLEDSYTCSDTFFVFVAPPATSCDGDDGVIIAPLQNTEFASYYIEWSGQTEIYNAFGKLIRTMQTPANWDARDNAGGLVATGAYYIFTNGEKKQEVTVVY